MHHATTVHLDGDDTPRTVGDDFKDPDHQLRVYLAEGVLVWLPNDPTSALRYLDQLRSLVNDFERVITAREIAASDADIAGVVTVDDPAPLEVDPDRDRVLGLASVNETAPEATRTRVGAEFAIGRKVKTPNGIGWILNLGEGTESDQVQVDHSGRMLTGRWYPKYVVEILAPAGNQEVKEEAPPLEVGLRVQHDDGRIGSVSFVEGDDIEVLWDIDYRIGFERSWLAAHWLTPIVRVAPERASKVAALVPSETEETKP